MVVHARMVLPGRREQALKANKKKARLRFVTLGCSLVLSRSAGRLDARASPEIRPSRGAAGHRQGGAIQDTGDHGHQLSHAAQHSQSFAGL
jgi:hypothetical protein